MRYISKQVIEREFDKDGKMIRERKEIIYEDDTPIINQPYTYFPQQPYINPDQYPNTLPSWGSGTGTITFADTATLTVSDDSFATTTASNSDDPIHIYFTNSLQDTGSLISTSSTDMTTTECNCHALDELFIERNS